MNENLKFCKHCGEKIPKDAIICTKCGRQVEELKQSNNSSSPIVINNNNSASSSASASASATVPVAHNVFYGKPKNKWIALFLCIFTLCGHKFYEEKIGLGLIYLFTCGFFFFGCIIDVITLLFKPDTYYV